MVSSRCAIVAPLNEARNDECPANGEDREKPDDHEQAVEHWPREPPKLLVSVGNALRGVTLPMACVHGGIWTRTGQKQEADRHRPAPKTSMHARLRFLLDLEGQQMGLARAVVDAVIVGDRVSGSVRGNREAFHLVDHIAIAGPEIGNQVADDLLGDHRQRLAELARLQVDQPARG